MIEQGDLSLPCRVTVIDGYTRPWHRAFRRTPHQRIVFTGFIREITRDTHDGSTITVEDGLQRLQHYEHVPVS